MGNEPISCVEVNSSTIDTFVSTQWLNVASCGRRHRCAAELMVFGLRVRQLNSLEAKVIVCTKGIVCVVRSQLRDSQRPTYRPYMHMAKRLTRIVLLLRDVELGLQFYRDALGLPVDAQGANFARLRVGTDTALELCAAESESQCSTGYSPFLTFEVQDMDKTIPQLVRHGAVLDGAIRYETYGKIAALRSPDGHMVGLFETAGLPDDGDTALAAASAAKRHMNEHDSNT